MSPLKPRPRHLPTLTHVVTEAEWRHPMQENSPNQGLVSDPDPHAKVREISDLLLPQIMLKLREELQANLNLQLHQLEARLRAEVESMVRDAMNGCETFPEP